MKHLVGFSGGADSQATALWVRQRFPKEDVILLFADAGGNEHPLTYEFVEKYSRTIHPVTWIRAQVQDMDGRAQEKIRKMNLLPTDPFTFDRVALLKGQFPSNKARFCTQHLKLE